MIVTSGKVPGVDADVVGSPSSPAARVVVWQRGDGDTWSPTQKVLAAMVATLKRIAPLKGAAHATKSADAALVAAHTDHQALAEDLGAPAYTVPDPDAIKTVYNRGVAAWPGEDKTALTDEEWGLSRVAVFLAMASGTPREGYRRDVDMLPAAHPARSGAL
jgi:hypothetical protein